MSDIRAIVCIGCSASGKSTWAKQFVANNDNWVIVCRDDERTKLMGGTLDWKKWNWKREGEVTNAHCTSLELAARQGLNVIVADTNLNAKFLGELVKRLEGLGYDVGYKIFEVDEEEAIRRDTARGTLAVGPEVIKKQIAALDNLKKTYR